jgi:hypothetical protein
LLRARPDRPFAYACDALLGVKPSGQVPALVYVDDGTLLLGGVDGMRILGADGCPRNELEGELASTPITALALRTGADETVYAVATGSSAGLWQSRDRGRHWTLRAQLADSELITAMLLSPHAPTRIYLSARDGTGAAILASDDGGASFVRHAQDLALVLLSADGRAPYPLWAMARDAATVGNRGIAILRATRPEGPWRQMLRVDYFGGFAIDAQGTIWVGDEISGIHRSDDGGDSFQNLAQDADVACLAAAGEALWACTPGTIEEPALQRISAGQERSAVLALTAVDRLVSCPDLDVAKSCAAAWSEWQRDVLQQLPAAPEAGAALVADAGSPQAASDASPQELVPDAYATPAPASGRHRAVEAEPEPVRAAHAACALGARAIHDPSGSLSSAMFGVVVTLLARRRARSRFGRRIAGRAATRSLEVTLCANT